MILPIIASGLLLLTFDDHNYDDWTRQLPLFAKYDAHVTFFCSGEYGTNELAKITKLSAAGHSIGLHTVNHSNVDQAMEGEGCWTYYRREIKPEIAAAKSVGLDIKFMAYPNNRHTPESDACFGSYFTRFRAGVDGMRGYRTNGVSIVSIDRAFFPVAELPKNRVLKGTGMGSYYYTDIDDICCGIRRAAERDEVFVLYSHDISDNPSKVGMRTAWLEKILATARESGVAIKGFKELGPVEPQVMTEPMRLYLTFDDGIKDHYTIAAEELEKRGWRGIFCITTDFIGQKGKLTWDDVRELHRRGHRIANHTKSHKGLGTLCRSGRIDVAREEISKGSEAIAREIGIRPTLLCLPGTNGHKDVVRLARAEGMLTMLVPRHCFGEWVQDVSKVIDRLRSSGNKQVDFLVHGVCRAGGGWKPFATRADFEHYLDEIKKAEQAGKVFITTDYISTGYAN